MKYSYFLFLLPLCAAFAQTPASIKTTLKTSTKTLIQNFQQKNFQPEPNRCGLTRFTLINQTTETKNSFGSPGIDRSSEMGAIIETSDLTCLKDYVVVQWIRGCVFSTTENHLTGEITQLLNQNREYRGDESFPFRHPEWVVDTFDVDPVYASLKETRFGGFSYPLEKNTFTLKNTNQSISSDLNLMNYKKNYTFFLRQEPKKPLYFVKDLPTTAMYSPSPYSLDVSVQNTSLQFKTCLYHVQDVPLTGDPTGEAIQCFEWQHNEIFNHQTKNFETAKEIAPFCLKNN